MPNNESGQALELMKEVAKEVAKDTYADVAKPAAKPTGELLGLIPRAIKAALSPMEQWILQKEYSVAETKKLLEVKLQNVTPALITAPEPYIAVPALQYISCCMDNEELRDMYANLLANSMNSVVKDGVHPAYVEIIRQLCPDEARILKYMKINNSIPTISFCVDVNNGGTKVIIRNYSNIPSLIGCERPLDCEEYLDNLIRLGLIERIDDSLTDKSLYEPVLNDNAVKRMKENFEKSISKAPEQCSFRYGKHYVEITPLGKRFCNICLGTNAYTNTYENSIEIALRGD